MQCASLAAGYTDGYPRVSSYNVPLAGTPVQITYKKAIIRDLLGSSRGASPKDLCSQRHLPYYNMISVIINCLDVFHGIGSMDVMTVQ